MFLWKTEPKLSKKKKKKFLMGVRLPLPLSVPSEPPVKFLKGPLHRGRPSKALSLPYSRSLWLICLTRQTLRTTPLFSGLLGSLLFFFGPLPILFWSRVTRETFKCQQRSEATWSQLISILSPYGNKTIAPVTYNLFVYSSSPRRYYLEWYSYGLSKISMASL